MSAISSAKISTNANASPENKALLAQISNSLKSENETEKSLFKCRDTVSLEIIPVILKYLQDTPNTAPLTTEQIHQLLLVLCQCAGMTTEMAANVKEQR
jgi:hypothetical protein